MKIEQNIKEILEAGTFDGNSYFLPQVQLDRKDYVKCNDVLNTIGMIWTKGKKAHIGEGENLEETFRAIIETGEIETLKEYRDRFQFFPTPKELAEYVVELAEMSYGLETLEPSAGQGAIIEAILEEIGPKYISTIELDPKNIEILASKFPNLSNIIQGDFIEYKERRYDRIIMNPPFSKSQDVKHVLHAYSLLKEGGILVSIASSSIQTRTGAIYDELRALPIEWFEVDSGAFKESGTLVNTIILKIKK